MPTELGAAVVTEDEGKRRFARLMLQKPGDIRACAHDLAYSVGIFDAQQIENIAKYWPYDPLVMAERERLIAEAGGPEAFLPGKTELGYALWKIADSNADLDGRLKAMAQYSKLMGLDVDKAGIQINVVNKVMLVPSAETDEEWEARTALGQRKLIEHEA
jgi:hypothetical protein